MSTNTEPDWVTNTDADSDQQVVEAIESRRDALETLANSDLPAAWIADALLDLADADGTNGE